MFTQEQIEKLIALADKLDDQGLHQEADRLDGMIKEAGVGERLIGIWNAIKGNPQLRNEVTDLHKAMQKVTFDLKGAVEKVVQTVGTLEKLTQKPQLQHMAKWAELVKSMGEEIKITIEAAKKAAALHEDFARTSQKAKALSEGREQPQVSGEGLAGEEAAAETAKVKKEETLQKLTKAFQDGKISEETINKLLGEGAPTPAGGQAPGAKA